MNVLLVYPRYPDTFWSFRRALKFIGKKASYPPLGLLTVASMLPKDWNLKLVDQNIEVLTDRQVAWADMVFVSAMFIQKDGAQEAIDRAKVAGKKVVAGGPGFTSMSGEFKNVDHLVLNEAEITLPLFLADLSLGQAKPVYTSQVKPDLKFTPLPMWSLINFKNYSTMPLQYSRGCPWDCEFCDIIAMYGRVPRTKNDMQMINEFQALYDAGWRDSVFFVDDNLIGNKLHVKCMLKRLYDWQKEHQFPFKLLTEASVDLADEEELMTLMSLANFHKVFVGVETVNADSLKGSNKLQNIGRDLVVSVRIIQRHGLQVMGGFIVGFDNDKYNVFDQLIDYIQKTGIVTAMSGLLQAFPGTKLWARLKQEGRLLGYPSGNNVEAQINFIPIMDRKTLIGGYKHILKNIYSSRLYYRRVRTFITNYHPTVKYHVSFSGTMALLKSFWFIGLTSKECLLYWHLLVSTLITKARALPNAIELAIQFLDLKAMTKNICKQESTV